MNWDIYYNGSWIESFTLDSVSVAVAKRYVRDRYTKQGTMEIALSNGSTGKIKVW